MIGSLKKSEFVRNVTIVMSGTAIAQLISVLISPLLTRIYGAESFGVMGIFVATVTVISTVAALRYDLAIVLPKEIKDSRAIFVLGLLICTFICILLLLFQFINKPLMSMIGLGDIAHLYFLIPIGVLFFTISSLYDSWLSRNKNFRLLSISTIIGTLASSIVMLLGWGIGASIVTLLLGSIFNNVAKIIFILMKTIKESPFDYKRNGLSLSDIKSNAIKYKDFVIYRAPQDLINSLSQNMPSLILGYIFEPRIVGFFWLANRVLRLPSSLISEAVRKVLYQKLSELHNHNKKLLTPALKATLALSLIGIIPILFVVIWGGDAFALIFGAGWEVAGEYSKWISIWVFSLFINVPAIVLVPIIGKQKFLLYYMLLMLPVRLIPIWWVGYVTHNAALSVAVFCGVNAISNFILIAYVFVMTKKWESEQLFYSRGNNDI
ncbi:MULTISPECIES: lipopolysaccharide biosynthesis protein [Raoultella]|jgi:O-antigen/teichoic acid export membrane protein|uniref:lipopolysaccharide biosynthesis protein n=1 Tax=Raoultella TaxID=160674 RepID=UPI0009B8566A|nr:MULTISPECIES: oligosaccharide flippase family protein [Raoultella]EKR9385154.1 oligosaccharide flippase family protein [Raoultella ornithinolytica]MEB6436261.1 oligosaccharide flippase family protein [Raoultella ornithinolytica]HDX8327800.1 oligosaccharide flippase family protein [Raoultella ornithinolytica CD1_MRS_4]